MIIRFTLPGEAVAKAKKIGRHPSTGHAMGFLDKRTESFQDRIAAAAQGQMITAGLTRTEDLVSVQVVALFERPKYLTDTYKRTGALKCGQPGRIPYKGKPDLDNIFKSVCDGLKWGGVFRDDTQVDNYDGSRRFWVAIGELPHVEVTVRTLDERPA